jgi:hypothetical protein
MTPDGLMWAIAPPSSRTRTIGASPPLSNPAVEERLDGAERELRVQFTRIAQLQAQLDVMSAALRRLLDGAFTAEGIG